jgi:septal ring factor EnvC (AmiA/AmiB activator)
LRHARCTRPTPSWPPSSNSWISCSSNAAPSANRKLDSQHAAIADLLRATYALGQGSDLRLLLGDEDVARISRALVYSKYFQQDRVQRVQQLMADLAKLQDLETAITSRATGAGGDPAQREQQAKTLAQQRAAQQKLAAETDAQYKDQAQRLAALKQNAQSLNSWSPSCRRRSTRPHAKRQPATKPPRVKRHESSIPATTCRHRH